MDGDHRLRRRRALVGDRRDGRGHRRRRRPRRRAAQVPRPAARGRSGCPRPRSGWSSPSPRTTSTSCCGDARRTASTLADLGEFTGTGRLVVRSGGVVGARPADRVPPRRTTAATDDRGRRRSPRPPPAGRAVDDPAATLLALLAHPNIASKAAVVHRYDHEIGGATLVRPLAGAHDQGHADGVVLAHPEEDHGIAVGIGVNPWYGLHDPQAMAAVAVDEAIRNVVAVGADPDRVALLDNFSWGDPRDPETLGTLVAAVAGCCSAAETFGAPFVSGKDSLNNTYTDRDGRRHSVPPTLVITAVAHVPDVDRCVTPELTAPGNVLAPRRRDRRALRRQPSRSAHRRPPHAIGGIGHHAAARPGVAGQVPGAAPGDPGRARGSLPRRQRGWSRRRPCRDVHRLSIRVCRSTPCRTSTSRPRCSPSRPAVSSSRSPPPTSTPSRRSSDRSTQLGAVTARAGAPRRTGCSKLGVDELTAAFSGSDW